MIYTALIGLAAGALAKFFMPGDEPGDFENLKGILITMLIGVLGGIVGGLIGGLLQIHPDGMIGRIIMATLGAVLLLWGYKKYKESQ